MPAFPSNPIAVPTIGPSNSSAMPASLTAERIVSSELFDIIPKTMCASLKVRRRGISIGDRSTSSACFLFRSALSPGEAVKVPSKSNITTATLPATSFNSPRDGSGVPGVIMMAFL